MTDLVRLHPPVAAPLRDVETERLSLRRPMRRDLDELAKVFAAREVWRFPYGRGFDRSETQAFLDGQISAWEHSGFGLWLVRAGSDDRLLGFVGLSVPGFLPEILPAVEVGWRLHPSAWGRGYASEAARAALREGFETLGLERICSVPEAANEPSSRVAERIGMRFDRLVAIPANEQRGELTGRLYWMSVAEWRAGTSA